MLDYIRLIIITLHRVCRKNTLRLSRTCYEEIYNFHIILSEQYEIVITVITAKSIIKNRRVLRFKILCYFSVKFRNRKK